MARATADHFEGKGYHSRVLFIAVMDILARLDHGRAGEILSLIDENIVQVIPRKRACKKEGLNPRRRR